MPLEYAKQLKTNRTSLDEHEKDENHLRTAEEAFIELSELYNWDKISCVKDKQIKTIEEINEEVLKYTLELEKK